jgi:LysM repeat protein
MDRVLALLDDMEEAWAGVSDYVKEVEKTERLINGRLTRQTILVKFRRPDDHYLLVLKGPNKGGELIYPKDTGEPVAIAHAGGFKGSFARALQKAALLRRLVPREFSLQDSSIVNGQHQTVPDSNLGNTVRRIAANLRKAAEFGEGQISLDRECSRPGKCYLRIDATLPADAGIRHEVVDGESLWTIANRYNSSMYVILYNNPQMKDPADTRPGQTVFVPRYYAPRGSIWISEDSRLLAKVEIFDSSGQLYERYEYLRIDTNVGLTDDDFDPENPEYGF